MKTKTMVPRWITASTSTSFTNPDPRVHLCDMATARMGITACGSSAGAIHWDKGMTSHQVMWASEKWLGKLCKKCHRKVKDEWNRGR